MEPKCRVAIKQNATTTTNNATTTKYKIQTINKQSNMKVGTENIKLFFVVVVFFIYLLNAFCVA